MNKSIPTLLGIAIILLVVIAVFTVFQYRFYSQMASGAVVVGTSAHQMLTGAEPQGDQVSPSDALAARMEKKTTTPIVVGNRKQMMQGLHAERMGDKATGGGKINPRRGQRALGPGK